MKTYIVTCSTTRHEKCIVVANSKEEAEEMASTSPDLYYWEHIREYEDTYTAKEEDV